MNTLQIIETPAEKFYKRHLNYVKQYQKTHKEQCAIKCKNYMERIKTNKPEQYEAMKQKKRDYYLNIIKPKRQKKKEDELI